MHIYGVNFPVPATVKFWWQLTLSMNSPNSVASGTGMPSQSQRCIARASSWTCVHIMCVLRVLCASVVCKCVVDGMCGLLGHAVPVPAPHGARQQLDLLRLRLCELLRMFCDSRGSYSKAVSACTTRTHWYWCTGHQSLTPQGPAPSPPMRW